MKKQTLLSSVVIIAIAIVGLWLCLHRKVEAPFPTKGVTGQISGMKDDLVSFSVPPNTKVVDGEIVSGSLKGAYFFEANVIGKLLDSDKNEIKSFPITATSEWMTVEPVSFSFVLDLSDVSAGQGYIRLQNDNPSGDTSLDKYIDIPVIF